MQYAINHLREKIEAIPGMEGFCPGCDNAVISKCGDINIWHFAHKSNKDCDSWFEPESKWHRDWKELFPKENREVIIGNHRADIKIKNTVLELQNSSISSEEILKRESFYKNMVWIINGKDFLDNFSLRFIYQKDYITFRWKHPRKCWMFAKKPIFIDMSSEYPGMIFRIRKIYNSKYCGGWGVSHRREWFLNRLGIKYNE